MATAIDATNLRTAIQNILGGSSTLTDNAGDKVFLWAQEYLTPYPTHPSWIAASFTGAAFAKEQLEPRIYRETWTVPFYLGIGAARQEYTGVQLARLWEVAPLWIWFMESHPLLQFSNVTTAPDNIDSDGITIPDQTLTLGSDDTDANVFLYVTVLVNIPFYREIEHVKYVDGNEVIIT